MKTILLMLLPVILPVVSARNSAASAADQGAGLAISRAGSRSVTPGPPKFFTGPANVEQLFSPDAPARTSGGIVTFAAGARSAWHTHPYGQILIVTAGSGRVQMYGSPIQEVHTGDVVHIPPNVKHWHGAAPDSSMTHIAIQESLGGVAVKWLEPVTDREYNGNK